MGLDPLLGGQVFGCGSVAISAAVLLSFATLPSLPPWGGAGQSPMHKKRIASPLVALSLRRTSRRTSRSLKTPPDQRPKVQFKAFRVWGEPVEDQARSYLDLCQQEYHSDTVKNAAGAGSALLPVAGSFEKAVEALRHARLQKKGNLLQAVCEGKEPRVRQASPH